jgi:hypothetical protein
MLKKMEEIAAREKGMTEKLEKVLPGVQKIKLPKQLKSKPSSSAPWEPYDPSDPWIFRQRPGLQGKAYKPPV